MNQKELSRDEAVEVVTDSIIAEEAECPEDISFYGMIIGHGESVEVSINGHTIADLMNLAEEFSRISQYVMGIARAQIDEDLINKKAARGDGGLFKVIFE